MRVLKDAGAAEARARSAAPKPAAPPPPPAPAPPAAREAPRRQASLADAVAAEASHPAAARSAATAAAASALLEAPAELRSGDLLLAAEPEPVGPSPLTLESVGVARKLGPGALRVPLVLRDAAGALHDLTLTLQIGPSSGEGGD
jgi:hypothetical protein